MPVSDVHLGYADWIDVTDYGEHHMQIQLFTDAKSLFDNLKKDGAVPDDKWVAVSVASLKGNVSAGPGRNTNKSECRWIASRWQLADCLTKAGLGSTLRGILIKGATRLHELSLNEIKKAKGAKSQVSYTRWDGVSDIYLFQHGILQQHVTSEAPTISKSSVAILDHSHVMSNNSVAILDHLVVIIEVSFLRTMVLGSDPNAASSSTGPEPPTPYQWI